MLAKSVLYVVLGKLCLAFYVSRNNWGFFCQHYMGYINKCIYFILFPHRILSLHLSVEILNITKRNVSSCIC